MESLFKERLLQIHHCNLGWKSVLRLLKFDPNLTSIYNLTIQEVEEILQINTNNARKFINDLQSLKNQSMLNHYKVKNIHILTVFEDAYPESLKQIFDPPWVIYLSGDLTLLKDPKKLSVVGTRNPSNYGYDCMKKVIVPLIQEDWTIVSGLAMGIDTRAHELAIWHKGRTIAVIAGGFDHIYPKSNKELARKISEQHLLISEYPPHTEPKRWQFPMRNRIISGLSVGTLVIEAKEVSGSLITANLALQQGREVFAIPGTINMNTSNGCNRLIQAGAKLVITSEDISSEIIYL
ncbi:DNA-processing protein DprA [Litchfieldia salsa]|uniref:DNA processing protein n=1 Tax=Litchfieldia salsa TaxID=930152 RepID=A0A1H0R8J5_9BACI|nr:DNA-processing protein DprA [Litchfieldia salsa]SDP25791.1 DNA processing protein [Litchfieldia salsa]